MKIRIILLIFTVLAFGSCKNNQKESERLSATIFSSLEELDENVSLLSENVISFDDKTTQNIKELEKRINDLEQRISTLENK